MSSIPDSQPKSRMTLDFTVDPPVIRGYLNFTEPPSLPPGSAPYLEFIGYRQISRPTEALEQTQEVLPGPPRKVP
jgi:hypothetical protein